MNTSLKVINNGGFDSDFWKTSCALQVGYRMVCHSAEVTDWQGLQHTDTRHYVVLPSTETMRERYTSILCNHYDLPREAFDQQSNEQLKQAYEEHLLTTRVIASGDTTKASVFYDEMVFINTARQFALQFGREMSHQVEQINTWREQHPEGRLPRRLEKFTRVIDCDEPVAKGVRRVPDPTGQRDFLLERFSHLSRCHFQFRYKIEDARWYLMTAYGKMEKPELDLVPVSSKHGSVANDSSTPVLTLMEQTLPAVGDDSVHEPVSAEPPTIEECLYNIGELIQGRLFKDALILRDHAHKLYPEVTEFHYASFVQDLHRVEIQKVEVEEILASLYAEYDHTLSVAFLCGFLPSLLIWPGLEHAASVLFLREWQLHLNQGESGDVVDTYFENSNEAMEPAWTWIRRAYVGELDATIKANLLKGFINALKVDFAGDDELEEILELLTSEELLLAEIQFIDGGFEIHHPNI